MSVAKESLLTSVAIVALSLCLISLPVYLFLFGKKETHPAYLTTLVQKTSTQEVLSPRFFSDYLGLNPAGCPLLIRRLDLAKIQKKLSQFPIFKQIEASFTPQGELLLSYELKRPLFGSGDYTHCGLDMEGTLFPLIPFYSPKNLPELYLGLDKLLWQKPHDIKAALAILHFFNGHPNHTLKLIDLSDLQHPLPAHRMITVTLETFNVIHYLRLNPAFIEKALLRYIRLFDEPSLASKLALPCIFDARIAKFATLKTLEAKEL